MGAVWLSLLCFGDHRPVWHLMVFQQMVQARPPGSSSLPPKHCDRPACCQLTQMKDV